MSILLDLFQIAHDLGVPHEEPVAPPSGGGGSTIVIVLVIVLSLVVVAGLIWLKKRAESDQRSE